MIVDKSEKVEVAVEVAVERENEIDPPNCWMCTYIYVLVSIIVIILSTLRFSINNHYCDLIFDPPTTLDGECKRELRRNYENPCTNYSDIGDCIEYGPSEFVNAGTEISLDIVLTIVLTTSIIYLLKVTFLKIISYIPKN